MEEWKEYRYTDIATLIGGGTPKTSNPSYWGGNIPWLSVKDFGNDAKYVYQTEKTITEEGLNNSSTKLLQKDDIIISARGTIGEMAMIPFPMSFNQSCFGIRGKENVDKDFLYYLTKTKINNLKSSSHGSVFDTITRATFDNIIVSLPSLPTQQKIANILSSLDDKIEVNRRINEQLEELAQALFKSWFVDFEPFKDGEFVESELGMIPKGWKVGSISEICNVLSGFAFKSSSFVDKGNYRLITIKGVQDGYLETNGAAYINEVPSKMPSYCSLNIGDILLSLTGNVGRCCYVSYEDLLLNQRVAKLYPKNSLDVSFVYTFFRKQDTKTLLELMPRGTAQANLSPIETSKMKVVLPERKVLDDFGCICNPLFWKMIHNQQEITHLTTLRDTLLPKLMSGEIDVNEVEI